MSNPESWAVEVLADIREVCEDAIKHAEVSEVVAFAKDLLTKMGYLVDKDGQFLTNENPHIKSPEEESL